MIHSFMWQINTSCAANYTDSKKKTIYLYLKTYNSVNAKLANLELSKLENAIKVDTDMTLRLMFLEMACEKFHTKYQQI